MTVVCPNDKTHAVKEGWKIDVYHVNAATLKEERLSSVIYYCTTCSDYWVEA